MCDFKQIELLPKIKTDDIKHSVNFSDEESRIYDLLLKGKSIQEIAMLTMLSSRTVSRRIATMKLKIDSLEIGD